MSEEKSSRWEQRAKLVWGRARVAEDVLAGRCDELLNGFRGFTSNPSPEGEEVFVVEYRFKVGLAVKHVWPDNDAPDNPSAQDVIDVIRRESGSVLTVCEDWMLTDGGVLTVRKIGISDDTAEVKT